MPEQISNRYLRTFIHAVSVAVSLFLSSLLLDRYRRVAFPDIVALARVWSGTGVGWVLCGSPWILALTIGIVTATNLKLWLPQAKPQLRILLAMTISMVLFVLSTNLLHGFPLLPDDAALTFHVNLGLIGEAALFMGGFVVASDFVPNTWLGIIPAVLGIVGGYIFYFSAGNFDPDPGLFFSGTQEIQQIAARATLFMVLIGCIVAASTLLSKAAISYVFDTKILRS